MLHPLSPPPRGVLAAATLLLPLLAPAAALAQVSVTLDPGSTFVFEGGIPEVVTSDCGPVNSCGVSFSDVGGPNVRFGVHSQVVAGVAGVETFASGRLLNPFVVSALDDHVIPARITGAVSWRGFLLADFGALDNESTVQIQVSLYELPDGDASRRQVVARQTLRTSSIAGNIARIPLPKFDRDIGSAAVNLGVDLLRGRVYMLAVEATTRSKSGAIGIATASGYENTVLVPGIPIDDGYIQSGPMTIRLQPDFLALLDDLRDDFENHTHVYLTGRGVGHNNTEAVTSAPLDSGVVVDGDRIGDFDPSTPEDEAAAAGLRLGGAQPNPVTGDLVVSLALPGGAPATLRVYDVAGRMRLAHDLDASGTGPHLVTLAEARALPPGIYQLRLEQAGRVRTTKFTIVR